MHGVIKERHQAAFKELEDEFKGRFTDSMPVVRKQSGSPLVEHVRVLSLPCVGKTHASIANGQIHVASIIGLSCPRANDPDGKELELVNGSMEVEAYRCCQIIEQVLRSCKASWGDLVRLTVHVPDLTANKLEAIEQVVDLFVEERSCPSITKTAVGCSRLRLSAAVQMEAVAATSQVQPPWMAPPPGLERILDPINKVIDSEKGGAKQILTVGGNAAATPRMLQGSWTVLDPVEEELTPQASESLVVLESEGDATHAKADSVGFVGHLSSVRVMEMVEAEARHLNPCLQKHHTCFCRVEMLEDKSYRTVRLGPGSVVCQRVDQSRVGTYPKCPAVWSFTFDVDVVRTSNSFVNVGLVEWITTAAAPGDSDGCNAELTLAQLLGVCPDVESCAWQHTSENPRQMMLGCRKGVKWYGNSSWEHLLKDDICEGTQLRFLCEYCIGMRTDAKQLRLWLQPSQIMFRKRGRQCVRLARPLFEWTLPPTGVIQTAPRACSVWVPAVTLFSQDDAVIVSWQRGASSIT